MQAYEKFIDDNRAYFEARLAEATDRGMRVSGFTTNSAKDSFEVLLTDKDMYYFPYCLLLIQFGIGVTKDKAFVRTAFETLLPNEQAYADIPILAYAYAYCENRDGDLTFSESILDVLFSQNFLPAITTRADLSWMHDDKENARKLYLSGARLGHFFAKAQHLRLFTRAVPRVCLRLILLLKMAFIILSGRDRGEKYIYLNFYGLKK